MRIKTLLAAVAACAVAGSAGAETTLTMWTFLDPAKEGGRDVALRQIIEHFEAANPDIRVKVEPQVWTTLAEKFVLGHGAGSAPDIGWVNAENLGLVLNSEAAADLKPIVVDTWSPERVSDIVSRSLLDAVTVDGHVLAMPIMPITWVMMYRKDLFDKAGLDESAITTWDGVTEAAKKLTLDTDGDGKIDVYGLGMGLASERYSATPALFAAIQANGGLFGEGCEPLLDNAGTAAAIDMQARWINDDKITPKEAIAMTSDDAIEQFTAGRYAMQIIASSRFERIQSEAVGWAPENLGIAPIPGEAADKIGPHLVTGWFAVVDDASDNREAAGKFVSFMVDADSAALWNIPGGQIPTMRSVAARPEMSEAKYAHLSKVAGFMANSGELLPGACNWARTLADFNLATQKVVLGQEDATAAVAEMQEATAERQ